MEKAELITSMIYKIGTTKHSKCLEKMFNL